VLRPLPTPHTLRATTDISGPDRPVGGKRVVNMQCPNIHHYRGTTVRAGAGHADLFDQLGRRSAEAHRDAARAADSPPTAGCRRWVSASPWPTTAP